MDTSLPRKKPTGAEWGKSTLGKFSKIRLDSVYVLPGELPLLTKLLFLYGLRISPNTASRNIATRQSQRVRDPERAPRVVRGKNRESKLEFGGLQNASEDTESDPHLYFSSFDHVSLCSLSSIWGNDNEHEEGGSRAILVENNNLKMIDCRSEEGTRMTFRF